MDQFVEVLPSERASCDDGVIVVDVRDFPALTDLLIVGSKAFEWADSTAAPDDFLQERLEGQGYSLLIDIMGCMISWRYIWIVV